MSGDNRGLEERRELTSAGSDRKRIWCISLS